MKELVIHTVKFAEEAIFDYENCLIVKNYEINEDDNNWLKDDVCDLPLVQFFKSEIKNELEEYIHTHSKNKYKHYFRVKWFDKILNRELMLFIYKSEKLSLMQYWTVRGICYACDWDEDDEYEGRIRSWIETKIDDLPNTDWVEEKRILKQKEEEELRIDEKERRYKERRYYERLFT